MTGSIVDFPSIFNDVDEFQELQSFLNAQPLGFNSSHCQPARLMLGWSAEALAFRSGVSPAAIRRIENGAELRRVTMQALAFALELEGLVFFPGHPPMKAGNCRGATPDPRTREDYNLLE